MRVTVDAVLTNEEVLEFAELHLAGKLELVQEVYNRLEEGDLGTLLADFCTGERETYNDDADDVHIAFDYGTDLSGIIDVHFTGSAFFGCKDMDGLYDHAEAIEFTINLDGLNIEFATNPPDHVERAPDEEF